MPLRVEAKAGQQDTRSTNRRLVLQALLRSNGLSRADLVRMTGLAPATVSALVADLLDEGLAEELGRGPAKVGKPSQLVGLNARSRNIVCVDLSDSSVLRAAVIDLAGEIIHRIEHPFHGVTGERALAMTEEAIAEAISAAPTRLLGIGIGTPGVVTPDGTVVEASNFRWLGLDVAQRLNDRFGHAVRISNDANAAALAEFSYGSISHNLMVIKIGSGVGSGIVLNGQQYYGEGFAAGEIGHITVEDDGPRCSCGNRGCLETLVSAPRLAAAIAAGEDPHQVVADAGRRLGLALAGAVSVLDIHDIVVSGYEIPLPDELCRAALASLRARTLPGLGRSVNLRPSNLGADLVLLGVSVLVLSQELGVA